jgi:transcriptional regulator with XRE-family HTH domain
MEDTMTIGERLRRERLRKGYGVRELARLAGVRYPLISELETGKKDDTTGRNLKRLARALGVSADYLLGTFEADEGDFEPTDAALVGA